MKKVHIKERSWIARLAARKLRFGQVAIVLGNTIYLHNVTSVAFLNSRRWVLHELMHVEQYQREGFLRFLWLYFMEYLKTGYYNNRFEVEARQAEQNTALLEKYKLTHRGNG